MNRSQRIAKFSFMVTLTALIFSLVAIGVLYFVVGLPIRRALGGFGFMGIIGFSALAPLFYKKEGEKVSIDERDLLIQKKASLQAYTIFWVLFVLACMVPILVLGHDGKVSVRYLAGMLFGGGVIVILVQSIVTLEEYGWSDKEGEES